MARTARTRVTAKKPVTNKAIKNTESTVVASEVETTHEEAPVAKEVVKATQEKKNFADGDMVMCKAIAGSTYLTGPKTKDFYSFDYEGAELPVAYEDLAQLVRTKSSYLFRPFLIVVDDDFVNAFPALKNFYDEAYSIRDLKSILYLDADGIKSAISKLPVGARDSVKTLVVTGISDGTYDPSMAQIKAFDEALNTQITLIADL